MGIKNISKNIVIAEQVSVAHTFSEKLKGLLGVETPVAFSLKTRLGIHTFGMKFPIDVIVCDNRHIVRVIKKNLKPNSYFFWNPRYQNVLELPAGVIYQTRTCIGDKLSMW